MIGSKLQELRKQKKYSLRTLAQLSGLSHSFICDIEHGRCNPSFKSLIVLANALSVNPKIFLNELVVDNDHTSSR